jgi:hypothetical protein
MKMIATVATLAAAAAFGAPSSAFAQQTFGGTLFNVSDVDAPYATPYGALPPYEVLTIIRSMGFDPQSRPVLRGRVYVIHAIDNQGIPLRVAVDASSGRVVRVVERMPGAGYGPLPRDRYGAYPVPPAAVPRGEVYEESDEAAPDYRAPDYRVPGSNAYPRPIYPQSSTQPPGAAPPPRVASRTPPATPTPRARPQAAPLTQDAKTPQGSSTQSSAPATTSSIEDSGRPGKSVPAPVASRKIATPPEEATAAKPDIAAKPADPALVPVAPLE